MYNVQIFYEILSTNMSLYSWWEIWELLKKCLVLFQLRITSKQLFNYTVSLFNRWDFFHRNKPYPIFICTYINAMYFNTQNFYFKIWLFKLKQAFSTKHYIKFSLTKMVISHQHFTTFCYILNSILIAYKTGKCESAL